MGPGAEIFPKLMEGNVQCDACAKREAVCIMKSVTEELLKLVSSWNGSFKGAFNIREDGGCAGRQSPEHIKD